MRCSSLPDSVAFLGRTHRHIASLLSEACRSSRGGLWPLENNQADESAGSLCAAAVYGGGSGGGEGVGRGYGGGGGGGGGRGYGGSRDILRPAMTYGEYGQSCAKHAKSTTARQVLGAMVRQAPGCSAARAQAIVRRFDSPLGFLLALEREVVVEEEEGDAGISKGRCGDAERIKRAEELLAGLTCSGGAGTNKLPQPLRRLLCRLFVGESERVMSDVGAGGAQGVDRARLESEEEPDEWGTEPMSQDDPY